MTNKRQSITPAETKLYLDHACEAQGGRTSAELAALLDVPPPRITEGRRRKWSITETHKQLIIEHFGAPKGSPGTYVRAETHASLPAFFEHEVQLSRHRHLSQIARIVNSASFKQDLAKAMEWADEPYLKIDGEGRPDNAETRAERLERLETLMTLPAFEHWLEGSSHYLERLCAEYSDTPDKIAGMMNWATSHFNISLLRDLPIKDSDFPDDLPREASLSALTEELGIRLNSHLVFPTLFVLGHLRYSTEELAAATGLAVVPPYTPQMGLAIPSSSTIDDYVITGSCIYDTDEKFSTPKVGAPCLEAIFMPLWRAQPQRSFALTFDLYDNHTHDTPERSLSVDYWVSYGLAVYMKDNCDYALHLSLSDIDYSGTMHLYQPLGRRRDIVIPDIPALELFSVLEELRKWLGMPELPLFDLKSQIAQQGGYIPGARVI